jgi:hypothetical protein
MRLGGAAVALAQVSSAERVIEAAEQGNVQAIRQIGATIKGGGIPKLNG